MGDNNDDFDDFTGYVAMVNDGNPVPKGCGSLITILILVLLFLCLLSTCLGH